jgi:hypothetical protein
MKPFLLTMVLTVLPRAAWACPVCAGETDAPLARATTLGVGVMLGVVAVVVGGFLALLWRLRQRSLALEAPPC